MESAGFYTSPQPIPKFTIVTKMKRERRTPRLPLSYKRLRNCPIPHVKIAPYSPFTKLASAIGGRNEESMPVAVVSSAARHDRFRPIQINLKEKIMGKYVLGWILGVPAIVLVVIYFFMH